MFVVALCFKSSLNWDETVAGKATAESTGPSQLKLEPTDGVACRHFVVVVGRGESEHKARTANQLVPTSLTAKKHSLDRTIRTVQRVPLIGQKWGEWLEFYTADTEAWWENTEILQYSQTTSLTNSCRWVLWHFFQMEHKKKLLMFTPKFPTAALSRTFTKIQVHHNHFSCQNTANNISFASPVSAPLCVCVCVCVQRGLRRRGDW